MQCRKCNHDSGDSVDKYCAMCGYFLDYAKFKPHEKVVLGIGLVFALATGVGIAFILYILYNVLVWNIFT